MNNWKEDIVLALEQLNGVASLKEIYDAVKLIRKSSDTLSFKATIRKTIEDHSSDSKNFKGKNENDLFYSVKGLGKGIWGLRLSLNNATSLALDIEDIELPDRKMTLVYRILRDTQLARTIKLLHKNRCQICGTIISIDDGKTYSEAHHIQPLGKPHNGPDIEGNILILCPNHHSMIDYGGIKLKISDIRKHECHKIDEKYIEYHNQKIAKNYQH